MTPCMKCDLRHREDSPHDPGCLLRCLLEVLYRVRASVRVRVRVSVRVSVRVRVRVRAVGTGLAGASI